MEGLVLPARHKKLLLFLNGRHGIVTGKELAERLELSERTVRSDIQQMNKSLVQYGIQVKALHGKGYLLKIHNREVFHSLFSEKDSLQTREDRIRSLIRRFAKSGDFWELCDLEEEFYVSRTTLESDLKEIKSRITDHQPFLKMERKGTLIRFEEDEIKRRNILIHLYCENWDYDSREGVMLREDGIESDVLEQIRLMVKDILKKYKIALDDFGLIYMTMAIAVCYVRILEDKPLYLKDVEYSCEDLCLKAAVRELLDGLSEAWELSVEEGEAAWLSNILDQLSILNFHRKSIEEVQAKTHPACSQALGTVLLEIREHCGWDLSRDERFCGDMLFHMEALVNGLISVQPQTRYLLNEMRINYPFLGTVAAGLCTRLENFCGVKLGPEEENYLLPLLVSARNRYLETQNSRRIKAAVVSHLNFGLTYYLTEQIRRQFGNRVKLLGPYPVYDREEMEAECPSFIITTVQMDVFREFEVPVVTVSPALERQEQEQIQCCISKAEDDCMYAKLPRPRSAYFRSELMLEIDYKMELDAVLSLIEENLQCCLYTDPEWKFTWEERNISVLKHGVLFAHTFGSSSQDTLFCAADLNYMLTWKKFRNIKKVLVLILNREEREYLGSFYRVAEDIAEHTDKGMERADKGAVP